MAINKIIGYVLLLVGVLLIVLPLYQTYNIFMGKAVPAQVFKQQKIETTEPVAQNNPFDIQQQMQKALMNILPIDLINNTLNLGSWMILMWVLIFGGSKLASLGVALVKGPQE